MPTDRLKPGNTKPKVAFGGGGIMVWGSITRDKVGPLVRLTGNQKGADYVNLLHQVLPRFPGLKSRATSKRLVWQQDNAPIHVCKVAEAALKAKGVEVLPWPALSPDMSPIENLWDYLARRVRACPFVHTEDQLWDAICLQWSLIPQATLHKLYNSMPRRLVALRKAQGWHTRY